MDALRLSPARYQAFHQALPSIKPSCLLGTKARSASLHKWQHTKCKHHPHQQLASRRARQLSSRGHAGTLKLLWQCRRCWVKLPAGCGPSPPHLLLTTDVQAAAVTQTMQALHMKPCSRNNYQMPSCQLPSPGRVASADLAPSPRLKPEPPPTASHGDHVPISVAQLGQALHAPAKCGSWTSATWAKSCRGVHR